MEAFDELQVIWNKQPQPRVAISSNQLMEKGEAHIKELRAGHRGTIVILTILIAALVTYFIFIKAHLFNELTLGLSIMIGVIIVRVLIEWISVRKFNAIQYDRSLVAFTQLMQQYYAWRKKVHRVFIPVIYISYIIGFSLLVPIFQENLSTGMFWYVVISGYGFLTGFAFLMVRILRKERKLLKFLTGMNEQDK
ncbi:MAG: hypothetical protein HOP30_08280 [Cyclobacteriaceae bacterium]|nr:hypothetical protein [Cyclobacteriaceae bacterium]